MVLVKTTQVCPCRAKADIDNVWANKDGYVPIKLLFTETGGRLDLPTLAQNYSLSAGAGATTVPQ